MGQTRIRARRHATGAVAAALLVATLTATAPAQAAAAVILVPGQRPTIQAAIDSATTGDVIKVSPGVYPENLDFNGKDLVVESVGGPGVTAIDGRGLGPVVSFHNGETRAATLRGFLITNGVTTAARGYHGGGVSITGASPMIAGNVIMRNHGLNGAGIGAESGSPLIEGNAILDNSGEINSNGYGGGIYASFNDGTTVIRGNVIAWNSNDNGGGVGSNGGGDLSITDNVITYNRAIYRGGAYAEINFVRPSFLRNYLVFNTAGEGSVMALSPVVGAPVVLQQNVIAGNYSSSIVGGNGQGAGFYVGGAYVTLVGNYVIGQAQRALFRCDSFFHPILTFSGNPALIVAGGPRFDQCANVQGDVSP